jgi:filamentous hemagglutinin family protein
VIARITSGNRSVIEGVLRSEVPGADLFLLNPAGIDFLGRGGGRRQLDLQGGFAASTADFLRFQDGTRFDVADLTGFSLSSAPVEAFGFLGITREEIRFDRAGLIEVPEGETLTVVAGDVTFTGFASFDPAVPSERSDVRARGGAIQLAAVGDVAAEVPLDLAQWAVRGAPEATLGNVVVEKFSELRANGGATSDGHVVLRGGRLVVDDARVQAGGTGAGSLALNAEFADEIVAREDARLQVSGARAEGLGGGRLASRRVEVSGSGARRTFVGPRPFGNTADTFRVEADTLVVTGAASLLTEVSGLAGRGGPGARLEIAAGDVTVSDGGELGTRSLSGAAGGLARIEADRLVIDGGTVRSSNFLVAPDGSRVFGGGQAGNLEVDVVGELVMTNDGRIEALSGPAGDGGDIDVTARTIDMSGGSEINATTINDRDAGNVNVLATERIEIVGDVAFSPTGIFARSGEIGPGGLEVGSGNAGDLSVTASAGDLSGTASVIELRGEAAISNRSRGAGNPGSLDVTADTLTLAGDEVGSAEISARARNGTAGGEIAIIADRVVLETGGAIAASTSGSSPGGRINVTATDLTITGVEPTAGADSAAILSDTTATGDAGEIDIDLTGTLAVRDGGEIRAVTRGSGDGGTIDVDAGVAIEVTGGGSISAAARPALNSSTGEAGDVSLAAPLIVLEGGAVTTEAANGTADEADRGGW